MVEFHADGYGSFGGMVFEMVDPHEADILIVGIPYESATSGKKGASFAPTELRKISVDMQTMSRNGIDLNDLVVKDLGNVPIFSIEGKRTRKSIEENYDTIFNYQKPLISLGGDHSNTFPILKSLQKKGKVGVIWFDAHRDLLDELMGSRWSHGSPLRRALELDNISPENVLLVGTRYMDPAEDQYTQGININELRMVDLEMTQFEIAKFSRKIHKIADDVDYLYVSIDIDVLDPAFAPATGTPVGGGMSTSHLMRLIKAIPSKVTAFDIMEVAPVHDHADITLKAVMGIITEIMAQIKVSRSQK